MPTYSYRCDDCSESIEVRQSIHDAALTRCPNCGGALRKQFSVGGISFKGGGFYRTDSRPSEKSAGEKSGSEKS